MKWFLLKMRSIPRYAGASYILGKMKSSGLEGDLWRIDCPVRINEMMDQNGRVSSRFLAEDLFSSADNVLVPNSSVDYFRELNEAVQTDKDLISEHANQLALLSAQRAGIVMAKANFNLGG